MATFEPSSGRSAKTNTGSMHLESAFGGRHAPPVQSPGGSPSSKGALPYRIFACLTWVWFHNGNAHPIDNADFGGIAQLVERFVRNEEARGSNPLTSSLRSPPGGAKTVAP